MECKVSVKLPSVLFKKLRVELVRLRVSVGLGPVVEVAYWPIAAMQWLIAPRHPLCTDDVDIVMSFLPRCVFLRFCGIPQLRVLGDRTYQHRCLRNARDCV